MGLENKAGEPQTPEQHQREYLSVRERKLARQQMDLKRRKARLGRSLTLAEAFYPEVAETLEVLQDKIDWLTTARSFIRREIAPMVEDKSASPK